MNKTKMTKSTILFGLMLLIFTNYLHSQEFKVSIYFEDVNNKLDTLIIGYDSFGTDSIDSDFLEEDISPQVLNGFDIRSYSINAYDCFDQSLDIKYATKIDIRNAECQFKEFCIGIPNMNLPVNISWDINAPLESCYSTLQLSDFYSGFWPPLPIMCNDKCVGTNDMYESPTITIDENCTENAIIDGEIIALLFIQLTESTSNLSDVKNEDIEFYPNPFQEELHIKSENLPLQAYEIVIYNINGVIQKFSFYSNSHINLSHLAPGAYIIQLKTSSPNVLSKKIIKY